MDIQHISALIEMLSSLGFPVSTNRTLLFYACMRQKSFAIRVRLCFGEDTMNYQLFLKEDNSSKKIICSYYDATLKKAVQVLDSVVNGISVSELEKRMAAVSWQMPPEGNFSDSLQIADKATWEQEATIEEITRDLEKLSITAAGAAVANTLKYKFWTDPLFQNTILEMPVLKSRYELSQRFYIVNEDGITTTEAYRFLNNRWMERQIHASNRLLRQTETEQREAKTVVKGTNGKMRIRHSKENVGK